MAWRRGLPWKFVLCWKCSKNLTKTKWFQGQMKASLVFVIIFVTNFGTTCGFLHKRFKRFGNSADPSHWSVTVAFSLQLQVTAQWQWHSRRKLLFGDMSNKRVKAMFFCCIGQTAPVISTDGVDSNNQLACHNLCHLHWCWQPCHFYVVLWILFGTSWYCLF